ncbi:hypothetical protein DFJ77DRAFT_444037 [Powellomyces hirtus]|nr:hypothetical protein DFJ77DRAFT_444037 [Powellomyces hirtus]
MMPSLLQRSRSEQALAARNGNSNTSDRHNNDDTSEGTSTISTGLRGSVTRSTGNLSTPRNADSERSLVETDPIAAIRALRSRLKHESSNHSLEMTALESQLAIERERKRLERESARKSITSLHSPSQMLLLRRANTGISTGLITGVPSKRRTLDSATFRDMTAAALSTTMMYDEQLRKLKQWQQDSKERVRQRETEREAEREKFRMLLRRGSSGLSGDSLRLKRSMSAKRQKHIHVHTHTYDDDSLLNLHNGLVGDRQYTLSALDSASVRVSHLPASNTLSRPRAFVIYPALCGETPLNSRAELWSRKLARWTTYPLQPKRRKE